MHALSPLPVIPEGEGIYFVIPEFALANNRDLLERLGPTVWELRWSAMGPGQAFQAFRDDRNGVEAPAFAEATLFKASMAIEGLLAFDDSIPG